MFKMIFRAKRRAYRNGRYFASQGGSAAPAEFLQGEAEFSGHPDEWWRGFREVVGA